jgi:hypothetical protein
MATHPPLLERIRALDPSFNAKALEEASARWMLHPPVGLDEDATLGLVPARSADIRRRPPRGGSPAGRRHAVAAGRRRRWWRTWRHRTATTSSAPAT